MSQARAASGSALAGHTEEHGWTFFVAFPPGCSAGAMNSFGCVMSTSPSSSLSLGWTGALTCMAVLSETSCAAGSRVRSASTEGRKEQPNSSSSLSSPLRVLVGGGAAAAGTGVVCAPEGTLVETGSGALTASSGGTDAFLASGELAEGDSACALASAELERGRLANTLNRPFTEDVGAGVGEFAFPPFFEPAAAAATGAAVEVAATAGAAEGRERPTLAVAAGATEPVDDALRNAGVSAERDGGADAVAGVVVGSTVALFPAAAMLCT